MTLTDPLHSGTTWGSQTEVTNPRSNVYYSAGNVCFMRAKVSRKLYKND